MSINRWKGLIVSGSLLLTSCSAVRHEPENYSNSATASVVWITQVTEVTEPHVLTESASAQQTEMADMTLYQYQIRDRRDRHFTLYEYAVHRRFHVGECVARWWDRQHETYPRLSKTDANCTLPKSEPRTQQPATHQRFNAKLTRKAVLNSWLDAKATALIAAWGPPQKVDLQDNAQVLEYFSKSTTSGSSKGRQHTVIRQCKTRWFVVDGYIHSYQESGNACF